MTEQTIISIIGGLVSVIAVLVLAIKMMLDRKSKNGNNRADNPVNLQSFITDCTREHAEMVGLLNTIKETLARMEEKLK